MARANFKLPDDFLDKITSLGEKTDEILPRVLAAGGDVALEAVRDGLNAVIGRGVKESKPTGELAAALGVSPARVNKEGVLNIKVGFKEPRSDGGSNAKIANIIEYGKHSTPPRPFLKPAKSASRGVVIEAMKQKMDEEIAGL